MVDSSPGLIAVSHVLHRLMVPRHPPCALCYLPYKMLALAMEFSRNGSRTERRTGPEGPAVPWMVTGSESETRPQSCTECPLASGRSMVAMP